MEEGEGQSSCESCTSKDMLIEILLRLPVRSLLRFRSVSKSWKNLIDEPTFISNHMHHQTKMKNTHLLVNCIDESSRATSFLLFPDKTLDNYQDLDFVSPYYPLLYGPCDGIFALCNQKERMALWNPATKQFRALPVAQHPEIPSHWKPWARCHTVGIGFDRKSNEYKVVWYRQFHDQCKSHHMDFIPQLLVYNLSSNSWRELSHEYFSSFIMEYSTDDSVYVNGVYYWLSMNEGRGVLLPFDFSDEQFQEIIHLPQQSSLGWPTLALLDGCIALLDCSDGPEGLELDPFQWVRIWVMVEKGHWVQRFEIGPLEEIRRPFVCWESGNVLIETDANELVLCDSFGQIRKNIPPFMSENLECYQTFIYSESLVPVKGGDHGNGSEEENDGASDFFIAHAPQLIRSHSGSELLSYY